MITTKPLPQALEEKIVAFLAEKRSGSIELHVNECGVIIAYKIIRTEKGLVRDLLT